MIARAGIASRRAAEQLITRGRVRVNGRIVTELGTKVHPRHDRVEVDGRRLVREKPAYYLVHKPRCFVTTMNDPQGRPSIGELLEKLPAHVRPVGRLDFHTSGALLATNDGELAQALMRPHGRVPKVYVAKLRGSLGEEELQALRGGVTLDDGYHTKPAETFVLREEAGNSWIQITLTEGKNRQIHRMGDAIGRPVQRLARISFAGIDTEGLRPGQSRPLRQREIENLVKRYLDPYRKAQREKKAAEQAEINAIAR